jgi:Tfp pilus assembly protein PilW
MDTTYASTAFYQALLKVPDWQKLDLTVAAQDVQHSGYPSAYANHEQEAEVLAKVFTGAVGGALTCTLDGPTFAAQVADAHGLTSQGEAVIADAQKQWGSVTVEGVAASRRSFAFGLPGGQSAAARAERGWAYANWAVSKAEALGITQVGFDGKTWSASNSPGSWQSTNDSAAAPSDRVVLTMTSGS